MSTAGELRLRYPFPLRRGSEGQATLNVQIEGPIELHLAVSTAILIRTSSGTTSARRAQVVSG